MIITGESGSGKTTTVKQMLLLLNNNSAGEDNNNSSSIFVLDVSDEYGSLAQETVDLGRFFSIDWRRPGQRVRFVPSKDEEICKIESSNIFRQLLFQMHRGELKDWVIVVEEGHRFSEDKALRTLLEEARKFTRKLILVCTDWQVYRGICRVYKPIPRN